jgi:hypothetical protein
MIRSRRIRWVKHVACMGMQFNAYRVLIGKPEGNKPWERPRNGWEDNIKMEGDCGLYSSSSGQTSEHSNEPLGSIKCWEFLEWLSNCWLLMEGLSSIKCVSFSSGCTFFVQKMTLILIYIQAL